MAEERNKESYNDINPDGDQAGQDDDQGMDRDQSSGPARADTSGRMETGETEDRLISASGSGWFVDFDVWQASLEAKFGPEFEQVLSRELGPDWVNRLNSRMHNVSSFQKVLDDIKRKISGQATGSAETLFELGDDEVEEGKTGFEALGPGEVIYDEHMVGPGGGSGGRGSRERELPNLADVRKKEFDSAGEQKAPLDEAFKRNELDSGATHPDDQVVLMDKNDFSRLSYFARKELDRHKDDLETKNILERESKKLAKLPPLGGLNITLLVLVGAILLYAIYALVSLPFGKYFEDKILAANAPDYVFQPSTALHKQGELSRSGDPNVPGSGSAVIFYFLQPSLNRFELRHMLDGNQQRFDISLYNGKNLEIENGPGGVQLKVHRFYSQNWPTNRSALLRVPYLSLSLDGKPVLLAFERPLSGMLPGLLVLDIVNADGSQAGMACVSGDLLHIRITDDSRRGGTAEAEMTRQMVFLFSLLEI